MSKKTEEEQKGPSKQQKPPSTTKTTINQPRREPPADENSALVNMCDTCAFTVGNCEGKPKFAIDDNPDLTGADADRVVSCVGYVPVEELPAADELQAPAAAGAGATAGKKPYDWAMEILDEPGRAILQSRSDEIIKKADRETPDDASVADMTNKLVEIVKAINAKENPTGKRGNPPDIVYVCTGGCGRTTEGMTKETQTGRFEPIETDPDDSGAGPIEVGWTCDECLAKRDAAKKTREDAVDKVEETGIAPGRPDPKRFENDTTDYGKCQTCNQPLKRTAYNVYHDAVRCTNGRCPNYRVAVKRIPTGVK